MKYRLLKDLPGYRVGQILEADILKIKLSSYDSVFDSIFSTPMIDYPDFFEPINVEDEKVEEAKKLLEGKGFKIKSPCRDNCQVLPGMEIKMAHERKCFNNPLNPDFTK